MSKNGSPSAKKPPEHPKHQTGQNIPSLRRMTTGLYTPSDYGHICIEQEFLCRRCCYKETFRLPQELVDLVDCEELAGNFWIQECARENGWISQRVHREDGKQSFYTLCPQCVTLDFERHTRFADHYEAEIPS